MIIKQVEKRRTHIAAPEKQEKFVHIANFDKLPESLKEALLPIRRHMLDSWITYLENTIPLTTGRIKMQGEQMLKMLQLEAKKVDFQKNKKIHIKA